MTIMIELVAWDGRDDCQYYDHTKNKSPLCPKKSLSGVGGSRSGAFCFRLRVTTCENYLDLL